MTALNNFMRLFPLASSADSTVKVIIGQEPYRQTLGSTRLAVDASHSTIPIYQCTGNVAFLVSEWIKVQDSLEMVFNLLFGHDTSLYALAELRRLRVSPLELAEYLWQKKKLLLVNRYSKSGNDLGTAIANFIREQTPRNPSSKTSILFVGNRSGKGFPPIDGALTGCVIHPSGTNLNTPASSERYLANWILCDTASIRNCCGVTLKSFRIFGSRPSTPFATSSAPHTHNSLQKM